MDAYVEVENVGVEVDGYPLLQPVSFSLGRGEALAISGANGAGKTTLLRILAGLTVPSFGVARVAGHPVDEREPRFRRAVAALIGHPPVARDLTLEEHLSFVAVSWGTGLPLARERAAELLRRFGIGHLRNRFPHELSSGQSQLFALALTLARPFDVLLLDEPEQRLDSDRLELVGTVLRELVDDGAALIFASHSGALMDAVAGRTVTLIEPSGAAEGGRG